MPQNDPPEPGCSELISKKSGSGVIRCLLGGLRVGLGVILVSFWGVPLAPLGRNLTPKIAWESVSQHWRNGAVDLQPGSVPKTWLPDKK